MARIDEIKREITDNFISHEEIIKAYGLDENKTFDEQFSNVAIENILFYNGAYRALLVEELFKHNLDLIDERIRNQRPHTLGWYRQTALNFQFGGHFFDDITEYDNTGLTADEIEAQRIIRKCSVSKADTNKPTLIIKVHKADGKLEADERTAFEAYMDAKADAGVNLSIISENADRLELFLTIRYDAMVMDADGRRFIDNSFPVAETITEHLRNLQFNGVFYPSKLEQDLMRQTGIRVATVRTARAGSAGSSPTEFIDHYMPFSGAVVIDVENDLHVRYERF